jgi:hypothetical protein
MSNLFRLTLKTAEEQAAAMEGSVLCRRNSISAHLREGPAGVSSSLNLKQSASFVDSSLINETSQKIPIKFAISEPIDAKEQFKLKLQAAPKTTAKNKDNRVLRIVNILRSRNEPADLPGLPLTDSIKWAVLLLKDTIFQRFLTKVLAVKLLEIAHAKYSFQTASEIPLLVKDSFIRMLVQLVQFSLTNHPSELPECDNDLLRYSLPYVLCRSVSLSEENGNQASTVDTKGKILGETACFFKVDKEETFLSLVVDELLQSLTTKRL